MTSAQALSDALWAALAASALATVAASHLGRPRLARLSTLVRRIEANRVVYVAVLVGWMWVGWHFFAR
ncbi:MAG TPA: DUF6186 family protein [Acidimicrobiales bacterium]|nr:DUF6186 family protein [Acidimicrobiales bacterium]